MASLERRSSPTQPVRLENVSPEFYVTDIGSTRIYPSEWGDPIRLRLNATPTWSDLPACPGELSQHAVAVLDGLNQVPLTAESKLHFTLGSIPEAVLLEIPRGSLEAQHLGVLHFRGVGQFGGIVDHEGFEWGRRFDYGVHAAFIPTE
jgi:hypothetical protein